VRLDQFSYPPGNLVARLLFGKENLSLRDVDRNCWRLYR
jgi:hypothetical protein